MNEKDKKSGHVQGIDKTARVWIGQDGKEKIVVLFSAAWWGVDTRIGMAHFVETKLELQSN